MNVLDRKTAEYYRWGNLCDGWRLLDLPKISVIEESVPAGADEVEHFHSSAHQFFYVLSGVATLEIGDERLSFGTGQGVHVAPGVRHRFVNNGETSVSFLVISTPSARADRVDVD